MRSRHVPAAHLWRRALRLAFVASVVALVSVGVTGAGRGPASHAAVLAASSAPFAASSPATTQLTTPAAPASTTPPATTLPSAHTGEAWASPWFVALLLLSALLGLACLWPVVTRRPRHAA